MSPAAIYKAIRDLLVFAAIAFIAWRVYSDGKNAVKAQQLEALQKQIEQQSIITQHWHGETEDANKALAESLARIDTAPLIVHDWVREPPSCPTPGLLSAPASQARNGAPDRGPILAVPGESSSEARLRDAAVADFKREWESKLAQWRAEHKSWPKP